MRLLALCLVLTLGLALPALAGSAVEIKLVEVNAGAAAGDLSVHEITRKVASGDYTTLASAMIDLPAKHKSVTLGGYRIKCHGKQKDFQIVVETGGKDEVGTVNTTVLLEDNKPFIVGLPGGGKKLLVFKAQ